MKPLFGFAMTWTYLGLVLYSYSWLATVTVSCSTILSEDGVSVNLDQHNNGDNLPNNLQPFLPDENDGGYIRALLCPGVPLEALPYFRFHLMTRLCYEVGTQGPCGPNMVFVKEAMTKAIGKCVCVPPGDGATGNHRPLLRDPVSNQCYHIYSQAFCPVGQWLTVNPENPNHIHCEANPCASTGATVRTRASPASTTPSSKVDNDVDVSPTPTQTPTSTSIPTSSTLTFGEIAATTTEPYTTSTINAIMGLDLNISSTAETAVVYNFDIDTTTTINESNIGTEPARSTNTTTITTMPSLSTIATSTSSTSSWPTPSTSTFTTPASTSTSTRMYEETEPPPTEPQQQHRKRRESSHEFEYEYVLFHGICTKLDSFSEFCDPDQILSFVPGGLLGCTQPQSRWTAGGGGEDETDNTINQIVPLSSDDIDGQGHGERQEEVENLIHRR